MHQRRAFTLLELLVSIGIIVLLASLLVVALRGIRGQANTTESLGVLRQMVLGYTAYSTDNNQYLMPGFVNGDHLKSLKLNPKLNVGASVESGGDISRAVTLKSVDPRLDYGSIGDVLDPSDASSYVWRLAPYVDHNWKTMFIDYRSRELIGRVSQEWRDGIYGIGSGDALCDLGIARIPSFGMNSIFVGGDDAHGGPAISSLNPWDYAPGDERVLAATRLSQVKNPSRLMVFAPSVYPDGAPDTFPNPPPISGLRFGSPEIRPPFLELDQSSSNPLNWTWTDRQWSIDESNAIVPESGANFDDGPGNEGGGVVVARWSELLPAGHLDGSTSTNPLERYYTDMRLWNAFAAGDYRTPP